MNQLNQPFSIDTGHGVIEFTPISSNPPIDWDKPVYSSRTHLGRTWGAQLFIGLSVNGVHTWTPTQIRDAIVNLRQRQLEPLIQQGLLPDEATHGGSIIPQFGFWGQAMKGGVHGKEKSVSVNIDNVPTPEYRGETIELDPSTGQVHGSFAENILRMAEELGIEFKQAEIYVRFYRSGVIEDALIVAASNTRGE